MEEAASPEVRDVPDDPVTTRNRALIFLGTYLAGAVIIVAAFMFMGTSLSEDAGMLFTILAFALGFLPWGVPIFLVSIAERLGLPVESLTGSMDTNLWPENPVMQAMLILSYASFLGLLFWGSLTKRQTTFRRVYLAFVFLLLLNVGGCLFNPP